MSETGPEAGPPATYHWSYGPADAPLLLCLHGIGSCADAFISQIPVAVRAGRRIVAWDAPGYRHSPDPEEEPGIDGWADAAADLIDHLLADRDDRDERDERKAPSDDQDRSAEDDADQRADVLGVSWGGVTATRLALRHPGKVRSLILADSSVGAGTSPSNAEAMRSRASALIDLGVETFARQRTPLLVNAEAPAELIDNVAEMMVDSVRMPSYQWACNSMAESDHAGDLPTITAPTLVVVGHDDQITGVRAAEVLADGIPGARLIVIEGAGHLANQERPEAFNDALVEFLGST